MNLWKNIIPQHIIVQNKEDFQYLFQIVYTVVQEGLPETYTSEIRFEKSVNSWLVTNTLITPHNYFKGYSLSLNGDIGINFFIDLTPEELESANVNFKWV